MTQLTSESDRGSALDRGHRLGYRPALDGVRAVAVTAVLLYHGGTGLRGGFLGVDVFFVLSGYLITSLLLAEWAAHGSIDLRRFWLRRARRLLPAVVLVLLAVAAYAALVATPAQYAALRGDSLATLAYASNWWFITQGQSYFAGFLEPSPLRHTWSLAIEEQFYLVFPVLLGLWLVRMRWSPRWLTAAFVTTAAASALWMAVLYRPGTDPSREYYGTDTRLQALAVGAAVAAATWARARRASTRRVLAIGKARLPVPGTAAAGLVAAACLMLLFVQARELAPWLYRGGFLVAAIVSVVLIWSVESAPGSLLARGLSWRPVVAVGLVSYGLYLWHWPVYVWLSPERTGLDGWSLLALRLGVTAVVAVLSYRLVEQPIRQRRWQRRLTRTQLRRAVTAVTVLVVATILVTTAGAAPVMPPPAVAATAAAPGPDGRTYTAFVLGDSQAYGLREYYPGSVPGLAVTGSTQLGCGTLLPPRVVDGVVRPNLSACDAWEARWTGEAARSQAAVFLVMLGIGELFDREVDGRTVTFGTSAYRDWLFRELDRRRSLLAADGRPVVVTTVPCNDVLENPTVPDGRMTNDPSRLAWLNSVIRDYASERAPQVSLADLAEYLCPNGFRDRMDGVQLRHDGLHFTPQGAALVWGWLGPQIVERATGPTSAQASVAGSSSGSVRRSNPKA